MYTICVIFDCLDGQREAFIRRVKTEGILDAIRAEDGYIQYEYFLSEHDPNSLLLVERWASKEAQQRHIEQPHMAQLRGFKGEYIRTTELREVEIK